MPFYTINTRQVFLHSAQNILLMSSPSIEENEIDEIIKEIAGNKKEYNIQEEELEFEVLIRKGKGLIDLLYNSDGTKNNSLKEKSLADDGMFYGRLNIEPNKKDEFHIDNRLYKLEKVKFDELNVLKSEEKRELFFDLADFVKNNFPKHFYDWELPINDSPSDEDKQKIFDHFSAIVSSTTSFYITRNEENKIVAVMGVSATWDKRLAYISLTLTDESLQRQGLMSMTLAQVIMEHPEAIMTAYIINSGLRVMAGKGAIVKQNAVNILSQEPISLSNPIARGLSFKFR